MRKLIIVLFGLALLMSRAVSAQTDNGYLVDFLTQDQDLWIRAVIETEERGPIEAVWRLEGQAITDRGDEVIRGFFYASPDDVVWGNMENSEVEVKIWFDASGRLDVNFFHASVPDIEVYSSYPVDLEYGWYDQKGTMTMSTRYIRQYYEDGQAFSAICTADCIDPVCAVHGERPWVIGGGPLNRVPCCEGSVLRSQKDVYDENCVNLCIEAGGCGGYPIICLSCGDGVCDQTVESECNCPEDCLREQ
jgi:hypothetical protein